MLRAFLVLGLTSFGGPIAHLGYFRAAFVARRGWLTEAAFADLVALCQFLPGPASSQVGFAIGLSRAGWRGALAAWAGFTLPSAALLLAFAALRPAVADSAAGQGVLHGLGLAAVAVVAQAVIGMARGLTPDAPRAAIGLAGFGLTVALPGYAGQLAALGAGAALGLMLGGPAAEPCPAVLPPVGGRAARACALIFVAGLCLAFAPWPFGGASLAAAFWRAGALVFGGGHVVLPLLRDAVVSPGWVAEPAFLAGYGAAQAVPGPLFTVAAYLGAVATPLPGAFGAAVALAAIFAPGLLILLAALPVWSAIRARPWAGAAMRGVNAVVVGLLAAALLALIRAGAVGGTTDAALALAAVAALLTGRVPPIAVVAVLAVLGGFRA